MSQKRVCKKILHEKFSFNSARSAMFITSTAQDFHKLQRSDMFDFQYEDCSNQENLHATPRSS